MIRTIECLDSKTAAFAGHCIDNHNLLSLVSMLLNGIDEEACIKWGIGDEQWQDAIIVGMKQCRKSDQDLNAVRTFVGSPTSSA